jgi:hypothetical protein
MFGSSRRGATIEGNRWPAEPSYENRQKNERQKDPNRLSISVIHRSVFVLRPNRRCRLCFRLVQRASNRVFSRSGETKFRFVHEGETAKLQATPILKCEDVNF